MECIDTKHLSYFEKYIQFLQKNWDLSSDGKKNPLGTKKKTSPGNYIEQMEESGFNNSLLNSEYFLTPEALCDNIEQRNDRRA